MYDMQFFQLDINPHANRHSLSFAQLSSYESEMMDALPSITVEELHKLSDGNLSNYSWTKQ